MSDLIPELKPGHRRVYKHGIWTFEVERNHILQSCCTQPKVCQSVDEYSYDKCCEYCRFNKQLTIPRLPDMVYPRNYLRLCHENGSGIQFTALDALKDISDIRETLMEVAAANSWKEARTSCEFSKNVIKPFDWTFTTHYKGTLFHNEHLVTVGETEDKINFDRLRMKEIIMFYENIHLYEDELSDHGVSLVTVKVRVMPCCFLILLRFYLRIDHVLTRIHDTRIYHEDENNYLLREYTIRESKHEDLMVPLEVWREPNAIWQYLPLNYKLQEKMTFS